MYWADPSLHTHTHTDSTPFALLVQMAGLVHLDWMVVCLFVCLFARSGWVWAKEMGNADVSRAALAPCQQRCHRVHELLAIATIWMACVLSCALLLLSDWDFWWEDSERLLSLSCPYCFNRNILVLRKIASLFFGMKFGEHHSGEVGRDARDWGVRDCGASRWS